MLYGYLRVSSKDQNEARQLDEMLRLGIARERLYLDKCSGRNFERPAWQSLLGVLQEGDLLIVKSIDRLGRNYHEIIEQWQHIVKDIGANIQVLDMPLLDTSYHRDLLGTLISDLVLQLLSFVAENERNMIRQRQAEGIAAAKARGVHLGRPSKPEGKAFAEALATFLSGGLSVREAAEHAHMSRTTFYRHAMIHKEDMETTRG